MARPSRKQAEPESVIITEQAPATEQAIVPEVESTVTDESMILEQPMVSTYDRKTVEGNAGDRPVIDCLDPDCPVDKLKARYTVEQRKAILDAIALGAIVAQVRVVTIKSEKSNTPQDEMINYVTYLPTGRTTSLQGDPMDATLGMTALSHGVFVRESDLIDSDDETEDSDDNGTAREPKSAVKHWIYGADLDLRNPVRQYLSTQLAGPVAQITKQVKNLVKMKLAKSYARALAMVVFERTENGEPVPADLTLARLGLSD